MNDWPNNPNELSNPNKPNKPEYLSSKSESIDFFWSPFDLLFVVTYYKHTRTTRLELEPPNKRPIKQTHQTERMNKPNESEYLSKSKSIDYFVWGHFDFLIVNMFSLYVS